MSGAPALEVLRLEKRFSGGRGVRDVSFSLSAGQIVAFLGVNGSGKSTTLRCVAGLLRPDGGRIETFGESGVAAARRLIGFLPEERGLSPRERVRDAVVFHGRLRGMGRREATREADRLLERLGVRDRAMARIEDLSKGNAQRIQIACAIVHRPRLLLLDEPLSGLDPVAQADIVALLSDFRRANGAVVFSTHAMASAQRLCDRVVMISEGRTVFEGPTEALTARRTRVVFVVTEDGDGLVRAADRIGAGVEIAGGDRSARRWRVSLPEDGTHPALMRALAEEAVVFADFQPMEAGLESAFWSLAVDQASRPLAPSERKVA